jgi:hypothetical protein
MASCSPGLLWAAGASFPPSPALAVASCSLVPSTVTLCLGGLSCRPRGCRLWSLRGVLEADGLGAGPGLRFLSSPRGLGLQSSFSGRDAPLHCGLSSGRGEVGLPGLLYMALLVGAGFLPFGVASSLALLPGIASHCLWTCWASSLLSVPLGCSEPVLGGELRHAPGSRFPSSPTGLRVLRPLGSEEWPVSGLCGPLL